jgi:hypothetical protein
MNVMLRETLSLVRSAGFTPAIDQRRHIHVRWRDGTGRAQRIIVPRSASDWRAERNHRNKLRKLLQQ